MRTKYLAALLALPLLAVAARAEGWSGPGSANLGVNLGFRVNSCWGPGGMASPGGAYAPGGSAPAQAGPWYLYWPMEAHFQTPAPTGYPYWPSPMTLPPPAATGAPAPGNFMPASYQAPAYGASMPYYWSR